MNRAFQSTVISISLGIVLFGGQPASAQSADEVVERLRSRYESIDGLRAAFRQVLHSDYLSDDESATGLIVMSRDQYRIETDYQTVVSDGQTTWIHDRIEDQVIISLASEDEATFTVQDFLFGFYDIYAPVDLQTEGEGFVVSLEAVDASAFYRQVSLHVRRRDDIITGLDVVDANETRLQFELIDLEINPQIPPDMFDFVAPESAEVIDLRS